MNVQELLAQITDLGSEYKAQDIKTVDVTGVCSFADFFVIMSGTSSVQIKALAEELILKCKQAGHPPTSMEGLANGEWVLLDFSDVVVHIFHPTQRAFYDLESLWASAKAEDPSPAAEPLS